MSDALQLAIDDLELRVQHALSTGDRTGLEILGNGDSTVVLACDTPVGRVACKRLPPFPSAAALGAYLDVIVRYVQTLRERGVPVLETRVVTLGSVAYCVQPLVESRQLLKNALTGERIGRLLDIVAAAVTDHVGLDADITNWCVIDDELVFLDVTTPMLRDAELRSEADYGPFLPSLPVLVRWFVSADTAASMLDKFYMPRAIVLDVLSGLIRHRAGHVSFLLDLASQRVSPRITSGELRRYCVMNECIWALFRRMQRLQHWWTVSVRRRSYPFLLPPLSAFAGHFAPRLLFTGRME